MSVSATWLRRFLPLRRGAGVGTVAAPLEAVNFFLGKDQTGMVKVKSRGSESIDQLLRRFKKACEKEGLTRSMKRVAHYEKPSVTRNRKKRQSLKRKLQATMLSQI
jgi:small subunit ribosomal protein S21